MTDCGFSKRKKIYVYMCVCAYKNNIYVDVYCSFSIFNRLTSLVNSTPCQHVMGPHGKVRPVTFPVCRTHTDVFNIITVINALSVTLEYIDWILCRRVRLLSLRVFGLLSSSLLIFPQRFGWYVLWPSSGVCRTRKLTPNYVLYWIHGDRLFWFR